MVIPHQPPALPFTYKTLLCLPWISPKGQSHTPVVEEKLVNKAENCETIVWLLWLLCSMGRLRLSIFLSLILLPFRTINKKAAAPIQHVYCSYLIWLKILPAAPVRFKLGTFPVSNLPCCTCYFLTNYCHHVAKIC